MTEGQTNSNNLLDTTDCLEAVGVFRGWKNFLFVIAICCLLLLQASFWFVNAGYVKTDGDAKSSSPAAAAPKTITEPNKAAAEKVVDETDKIQEAAKQVVAEDSNQPSEPSSPEKQLGFPFSIKVEHLTWLIRFLNFVLVLAATLYCLTMLFSLKVSLLGRLGGINHICRAFFLSLTFLVLLLPWQRFFAGVVAGAMYTPEELLSSCAAVDGRKIFGTTLHYLRFTGYWLLVVLLLILSQLRSARWAKTILRRLEVI